MGGNPSVGVVRIILYCLALSSFNATFDSNGPPLIFHNEGICLKLNALQVVADFTTEKSYLELLISFFLNFLFHPHTEKGEDLYDLVSGEV